MATQREINDTDAFPPGGITPVYNEISALLTLSPRRPEPEAMLADLDGPSERVLMRNIKDEAGIVQPTVFVRSDTFAEPSSGLNTQVLSLAACSGVAKSELLGGELAVHVRNLGDMPEMTPGQLPPGALDALDMPLVGGRAVTPRHHSIGKIQALFPDSYFPARVAIPVYYSFILGVRDGTVANVAENVSVEGQEPHYMEAVVKSVPPDPESCLKGREWDLVTQDKEGFLKLWVKIECFRFLGLADWKHQQRPVYRNGSIVWEDD